MSLLEIPGQIPLEQAKVGDVVVFQTGGAFGALIGAGEWLRRQRFHEIHHCAVLSDYDAANGPDPAQCWRAIQAARRVDEDFVDTIAHGREYAVLPLPSGVSRDHVLAQARTLLGCDYGVLSIASIALNIFTPDWLHIDFRYDRTIICSALVAFCLLAGGYIHDWDDYYEVLPSQIVELLSAEATQVH